MRARVASLRAGLAVEIEGTSALVLIIGVPPVIVLGVVPGLIGRVPSEASRPMMLVILALCGVRVVKCLGTLQRFNLGLFLIVRRLGLFEDGHELFSLIEPVSELLKMMCSEFAKAPRLLLGQEGGKSERRKKELRINKKIKNK